MVVSGLACELHATPLLTDIEIDARTDAVALLGPSGAGKTMVLRCLLGLAPAAARVRGQLRVADDQCVDLSQPHAVAALRGAGLTLLPQAAAASLDPLHRVATQVHAVLQRHGNRDDTPTSLLELVGLDAALLSHYAHQLSGGQAARVALALALACRPKVLLCDEPSAALDNIATAELMRLLQTTRLARNFRLVLVTHDLAVAAGVCSRAVVLDAGVVVESGTLASLVMHPQHSTTRRLVRAAQMADAYELGDR